MKSERIHWVDSLRGLAIVLMIAFHFAFDIDFLEILPVNMDSGLWLVIGNFVRFTILSLVGVSLFLSRKKYTGSNYLKRQLIRAVKLFLIAMGISLATWLTFPDSYIRFGVLHLISIGIIAGALLVKNPRTLAVIMFLMLILGSVFTNIQLNTSLLLPFGITPHGFNTLDYFPLFPWLAIVFFGIVFAYIFDSYSLLANPKKFPRLRVLEKTGQKSLIIYLIHQPVLLGLIWLFA